MGILRAPLGLAGSPAACARPGALPRLPTRARAPGREARRTWECAQSADAVTRCCDVIVAGRAAQVKVQGDAFATIYDALDGVELAFLRADRREGLCVVRAEE